MRKLISLITMSTLIFGLFGGSALAETSTPFQVGQQNLVSDTAFAFNYQGSSSNILNRFFAELLPLIPESDSSEMEFFNDMIINNDLTFVVGDLEEEIFYGIIDASEATLGDAIEFIEQFEGLERETYKGSTIFSSLNRDDFAATYHNQAILITDSVERLKMVIDSIGPAPQMEALYDRLTPNSHFSAMINYDAFAGNPNLTELGFLTDAIESQLIALDETSADHFQISSFTQGNQEHFDTYEFNYQDFQFQPHLYQSLPGADTLMYAEMNDLYDLITKTIELAGLEDSFGAEYTEFTAEYGHLLELLNNGTALQVQLPADSIVPYFTLLTETTAENTEAAGELTELITTQIDSQPTVTFDNAAFCELLETEKEKAENELTLRDNADADVIGFTETDPQYEYYSNLSAEEIEAELVELEDFIETEGCNELETEEETVTTTETTDEAETEDTDLVVRDLTDNLGTDEFGELKLTYGLIDETHYVISNHPEIESAYNSDDNLGSNSQFVATFTPKLGEGLSKEVITLFYSEPAVVAPYMNNLRANYGEELGLGGSEDVAMWETVEGLFENLEPWYGYSAAETPYSALETTYMHIPVSDFVTLLVDSIDHLVTNTEVEASFEQTLQYEDVDFENEEFWHDALIKQSNRGIIQGSEEGFRAGDNITRAEFMALLVRHYGLTGSCAASDRFTDVVEGAWYDYTVCTAVENGIVRGDRETVNPDDTITRAEAAQMMVNFSGVFVNAEVESDFSDVASEELWYFEAVGKAASSNIVTGSDGKFRPNDPLTRAEAATLIDRLDENEFHIFIEATDFGNTFDFGMIEEKAKLF